METNELSIISPNILPLYYQALSVFVVHVITVVAVSYTHLTLPTNREV